MTAHLRKKKKDDDWRVEVPSHGGGIGMHADVHLVIQACPLIKSIF
jgi:hypothetical protein